MNSLMIADLINFVARCWNWHFFTSDVCRDDNYYCILKPLYHQMTYVNWFPTYNCTMHIMVLNKYVFRYGQITYTDFCYSWNCKKYKENPLMASKQLQKLSKVWRAWLKNQVCHCNNSKTVHQKPQFYPQLHY